MEEKIQQIYKLSVDLYYEVADDNMKRRGHPGVMGPPSIGPWNLRDGVLEGAIQTLKEVSDKLKQ